MSFMEAFGADRMRGENRVRENTVVGFPVLEQIMPTVGWYAVMRHPTHGTSVVPLVCWGLYKLPTGVKVVTGLTVEGRKVVNVNALEGLQFQGYTTSPLPPEGDTPLQSELDML